MSSASIATASRTTSARRPTATASSGSPTSGPRTCAWRGGALLHWRDLERRDGAALLRATGLLEVGGPHEEIVAALRAEHATVVELDGAEAPDLFPGLTPRLGQPARWQPAAGVLAARDCLLVQADLAARAGAEIAIRRGRVADRARRPTAPSSARRLRRIEVDVAVVATGPWLNELLRAARASSSRSSPR